MKAQDPDGLAPLEAAYPRRAPWQAEEEQGAGSEYPSAPQSDVRVGDQQGWEGGRADGLHHTRVYQNEGRRSEGTTFGHHALVQKV